MALYEHKEFLNFDDVTEYLIDKNIIKKNDNTPISISNFLVDLLYTKKIDAVFYHSGVPRELLYKRVFEIEENKKKNEIISLLKAIVIIFDGYLIINDDARVDLLTKGNFIFNYGYIEYLHRDEWYEDSEIHFISKLACNKNLIDYTEKSYTITDLLYPKIDLDKLFNQQPETDNTELLQQVADQQATIDRLTDELANANAKIAELVAGKDNQSDTPDKVVKDDEMETKSLNAVSRLIYVLLNMASYDLSTHSGNGNTAIIARSENLLKKPLSKKFISDWIKNAQNAQIEYGKK